jgi:hypothetical protein
MTTRPSLFRDHGGILLAGSLLLLVGIVLQPSAGALQDDPPPQTSPPPLPPGATHQVSGIGTAMSGNGMIAATAIDMTGSNVLYVLDTNSRQLAVYQANGGSDTMQSLKLIGARRIDLDLQLQSFNDKSKKDVQYAELEKQFQTIPVAPAPSQAPARKNP